MGSEKYLYVPPDGRMIENRRHLFAITTIAKSDKFGGTRTPVVCTTLARAKEIIETNEGDIWESSYMLAVIEAVVPDHLYDYTHESYWYRWDLEKKCYEAIECPPEYKNTMGFGVG